MCDYFGNNPIDGVTKGNWPKMVCIIWIFCLWYETDESIINF